MSVTIQPENLQVRPQRAPTARWWGPACLVLLGFLSVAVLFEVSANTQQGGSVIILGALLGLPVLLLLAKAGRQILAYMRAFIPTLNWWHLLWALMVVSALVFRRRSAADINADPLDAWAVFRLAIDMVVAFLLLGRLALRRTHWLGSMFRGAVGAMSIYGLVCLASAAWSVYASWTIFKSWEYLLDIAVLAAVVETLDTTEQYGNFFNWTWTLYGILLLGVWAGVVLWPKDALYSETLQSGAALGIRLSGVLPAWSSNDVSNFSAVLALVSMARLFPAAVGKRFHKPWYALLLLASLTTLILSQTRTAIVGFAFGCLFILLFSNRGRLGRLVVFVVAPVMALGTMGGLIWSFMDRGQNAEQLTSLSSRADWWALAWHTFLQQPLTGFGAYAAGRFAVMAQAGQGTTGTLHSDYLEVIVGTGVWGLIPLIAALAGTWWLLLKYRRNPADQEAAQLAHESLAILALLTFRSIFNNMMTWHPALPYLAVLGFGEFLRRRRKAGDAYSVGYLQNTKGAGWKGVTDYVPEGEN